MTDRERLQELRDLAKRIDDGNEVHINMGDVRFYRDGDNYFSIEFNDVDVSSGPSYITVDYKQKNIRLDDWLFHEWANDVEDELVYQIDRASKEKMIEVDGKEYSEETIKSALRDYTNY